MASAAPPVQERRPAAADTPPLQLKAVATDTGTARPVVRASLSATPQAKRFVSSPGDPAEREADRVAKQVMEMPAPAVTARGERSAQRVAARPLPVLPRAPSPSGPDSAVAAKVRAAATGGAQLSRKTRAFLEPRFRADFSGVMIHTDAMAARLANELGARAFTYGRHIFFAAGQYNPDTRDGLELLAHELTHTIQQCETIQRKEADPAEAPRVSERTGRQASRLGISDALDYFADAANAIPGYRMFTILIGVNPINMSAVEASAANILRAIVEFLPGGNIITRVLDSYGIFDKVGSWIEGQLKSLGITGAAIRAAIDRFLDSLGWRDIFSLGSVWNRAKAIFTDPISRILAFARGLFSKILEMVQEAVLKPLAALAAQTPFYTLLKAVLGKDPVTGEKFEGGAAEVIGGFMTMIGQQELWQNIQRANAIPRAFAWFKTAMKGLVGLVSSIPTRFIDGLKSLEIMDFVVLPRAFAKIGSVIGSFLADFGSWALGTVIDLLKIIVEVVAPAVLPYIAKAAGAFNTILRNPIGFVGNLVKAAMQGFRQFASNFLTHLQASLVGWLTGAMAGANIYIPQGLNLREILKFVLSILGLTWANIRAKLVRATNETTVVALETGFDIVRTLVTEGPAAAWQKIIEVIGNLKQMAIDAIMDFVKSRVVQAAVTRLLSMLSPAGAFIQAIIAIYNTIMFFVERLRQIAAVAASFIDSIAAIASGSLGAAANRVETTMAGLLTLVISFLARIAGLGRVSDAVTNLINRIRAPIDRALDAVVNWIVTQARRLGRFLLQAGTPADPNARLRLAIRDARLIARGLGNRISRSVLETGIAILRTRYGLSALRVTERNGRYLVFASINPMIEEEVAQALSGTSVDVERLIDQVAGDLMSDPRVVRERERVLRAHQGPAGMAAAGNRGSDTVIPTIAVGPGPGMLGAAAALQDANRPARFSFQTNSPHEFMAMPFRAGVSGEMQSTPGPGGVIVGRGQENGARVSVSYPALVQRFREIANAQTPPIGDRQMASILVGYLRSGAMPRPFDQGNNALFLAEMGRVVGSVEVARSQSAAVELAMITRLVQTGTLTIDQAFARESQVNPMTMTGAPAAARARQNELLGSAARPGGEAGTRVDQFVTRRRQLIIAFAMQEIRSRRLTFATPADVQAWARTGLVEIIRARAEELFGLRDLPN